MKPVDEGDGALMACAGYGCVGGPVGAIILSFVTYFTSGASTIWSHGEGIEEGIFMITVPPAGFLLGAVSAAVIDAIRSRANDWAAMIALVGGVSILLLFALVCSGGHFSEGWRNYGAAALWAAILVVFGLIAIARAKAH